MLSAFMLSAFVCSVAALQTPPLVAPSPSAVPASFGRRAALAFGAASTLCADRYSHARASAGRSLPAVLPITFRQVGDPTMVLSWGP